MRFENKTALVTGAAFGIGRAVAKKLAADGAALALTDIAMSELETLKDELEASGTTVYVYECDVSDETRVREVADDAIAKLGHLDILINNAAYFREGLGPFVDQDPAMWRRKIDVNILGTMFMTHAVLPHMYERRKGSIVNVASVAGIYGIANLTDYSMTKGAVLSFTYALAREAAAYNVNVNAMSPGNINARNDEHYTDLHLSYLGPFGTPEECANVICFLASDEAKWVSGVNFTADGCRAKI